MKKLISFILAITVLNTVVLAHGGEDHGDTKQKTIVPKNYFVSVANSDKYELLLKYQPIEAGEKTVMQLFVSAFSTNKPIDNAAIQLSSFDDTTLKFSVKPSGEGIYLISGIFPSNTVYSFNVSINSEIGPDLMELKGIEVGKQLPVSVENKTPDKEKTFFTNRIVLFVGGFLLALLLMLLIGKLKNKKANVTFLIIILLLGTTPLPTQKLQAHGGEDHGGNSGKNSGGNLSTAFEVPKETQFLFSIFTEEIEVSDFAAGTKLFGTVIPSSSGQALVTTPQNGRIVSLNVNVGQQVKQGQQLAVIEQNIDAAAQVNLLAEKNNIEAEFEAAKKEYDRLKTIQDIASKKEFSEAEARYQKADGNKKLFSSSGGRTVALKSPIDGIVGNFTFSLGSTLNANETVFTLTNLAKVYVEAQVFDKDAEKVNAGVKYSVQCTNDDHKTAEVKLLALAQSINPTNQSQRVLFEMENKGEVFKIGEFVNITVFASIAQRLIAVPNSAISELNGKPVVFVKDGAEQYSLNYVSLGENNGSYTVITKGIEEGERIVSNGAYQMKMIYLNQ
jgi:cobalt-zinc-cadmium efflux system membrane fusion protein